MLDLCTFFLWCFCEGDPSVHGDLQLCEILTALYSWSFVLL